MFTNEQRTVGMYLDAVAAWNLDENAAADLIGALPQEVREWWGGKLTKPSEEMLARMMMVAQIRTALEICWSAPLSREWIRLPNGGDPYRGLSPIAYTSPTTPSFAVPRPN